MAQTSTVTPCMRGSQRAWLNYEFVFPSLSFHFSCTLTRLTHATLRLSKDPVDKLSARDEKAPSHVRIVWIMRLNLHVFSKRVGAAMDEIEVKASEMDWRNFYYLNQRVLPLRWNNVGSLPLPLKYTPVSVFRSQQHRLSVVFCSTARTVSLWICWGTKVRWCYEVMIEVAAL